MALKKNSTGRQLYMLLKLSTGEILKRNTLYPNVDESAPIEGLDPDLKYAPIDETPLPEIDEEFYFRERTEGFDEPSGLYQVVEVAAKRPTEEIKQLARNVRAIKAQEHIDPQEAIDRLSRVVFVLIRRVKGLELTEREAAEFAAFTDVGAALWMNDAKLKEKLTLIDQGKTPDLREGYLPVNMG